MARPPRGDSREIAIGVQNATTDAYLPVKGDATSFGMYVHIVGDDVGIGGGTAYTEDAAKSGNAVGETFMMVRDDALSAVTPAEGDWIPLRGSAEGAVWTQDFNSDAILADTTAIKTAVQLIDNAISGNEMQVDIVSIAAGDNNIGNVDIASIAAGDNNIGNVDIATIAAGDNNIGNVDIASALPAGDNNIGNVDIASALPTGANAIGKLAANSGVDIGDVDVTSQPARDNATDTITASLDTNAIMNDTTALTPKYEVIDDATSGNNTIVAAVVGKKIRVLALFMIAAGDVLARFEDGAGGTALTGQMDLTTNSGFVLPFNPVGWFETTANTLLNLELDGAVSCDGSLVYVEV